MLYEYAVEPRVISSSWQTCRYLSEKFGFDRARLLALYPDNWLPLAIAAAVPLRDYEKKRIVEMLTSLRRNASIQTRRPYNLALNDWLRNAVAQQAKQPFHAILAAENPDDDQSVLITEQVDESHPLMMAPHDCEVVRDAETLAAAMALLLKSGKSILFVDGYYDPFNARYQNTLRECLKIVQTANSRATCEIHHLDLPKSPPVEAIEREAKAKFATVIPQGMTVTIYRWREKAGGADFHARYLLTDKGGIRIDAGFSAEGRPQKTDMALMDCTLAQEKRMALRRGSSLYELVEPVLQIAPSGYVEHV